jgi:hypothetical protein
LSFTLDKKIIPFILIKLTEKAEQWRVQRFRVHSRVAFKRKLDIVLFLPFAKYSFVDCSLQLPLLCTYIHPYGNTKSDFRKTHSQKLTPENSPLRKPTPGNPNPKNKSFITINFILKHKLSFIRCRHSLKYTIILSLQKTVFFSFYRLTW